GDVADLAEPDRRGWPLDRLWPAGGSIEVVVPSLERDRLLRGPEAADQVETLVHAIEPVGERGHVIAVGGALGSVAADVVKEDQPTAGERVEGRRHLGGQRGRPENVRQVDRAELNPRRPAGEERQRRPSFQNRAVLAENEVVGHPERVVAKALGQERRRSEE